MRTRFIISAFNPDEHLEKKKNDKYVPQKLSLYLLPIHHPAYSNICFMKEHILTLMGFYTIYYPSAEILNQLHTQTLENECMCT